MRFSFLIIAVHLLYVQLFSFKLPPKDSVEVSYNFYKLFEKKSAYSDYKILFDNYTLKYIHIGSFNSFQISFSRSNSILGLNNTKAQTSSFLALRKKEIIIDYNQPYRGLIFNAKLGLINNDKNRIFSDYTLKITLNTGKIFMERISLSMIRNNNPFNFDFTYLDQHINLRHHNLITNFKIDYQTGIYKNFLSGLTYTRTIPINNLDNDYYSAKDIISDEGIQFNLDYEKKSFHAKGFFIYNTGNLSMDIYQAGLPFSYLSISEYRYRHAGFSLGINNTASVLLNYINSDFAGAGNIETWPFTDLIKSLFMNRVNFKLSASIQMYQIIFSGKLKKNGFEFTPKISFQEISPNISFDNWQPAFLVFGIENFTSNQFSIKKAGIAGMELGISSSVNNLFIHANIRQYIPLYTTERKSFSNTPGEPISSTQPVKNKIDGGRQVSLKVSYNIK